MNYILSLDLTKVSFYTDRTKQNKNTFNDFHIDIIFSNHKKSHRAKEKKNKYLNGS